MTSCARPTRSGAAFAIPRGWAGGRPSCGSSCRRTCLRRSPNCRPTSCRCSSGWAGERPVGHLPDGPADGARTPARRLLQRGLLARIDALNVELPREIGVLLRGDRPYGPPRLRPEPTVTAREQQAVDRRAAGAAMESVGRVAELLGILEEEPAGLLRSGG